MAKDPFFSQTKADGDCLLWTGPGFGPDGYGLYKDGDRRILAHRFAFEQKHGYLPEGPEGVVRQTCGNKRCVAEGHLVDPGAGG